MKPKHYGSWVAGILAGCAALGTAVYATLAGMAWYQYGAKKRLTRGDEADSLLDVYIPDCEVVERHHLKVSAPAEATFSAARTLDSSRSQIIRAIFKLRELALTCATRNAHREEETSNESGLPRELAAQMKAIGWVVLAEIPGHEIVFGAVTQPWLARPIFQSIRPEEFAEFGQPGYVKIAWTLRADAVNAFECIVRTETRATTTDATARAKFRRYWSLVLPGIVLIRRILLRAIKRQAEHQARETKPQYETAEFGQYVE
jgi:hypothetical protein